MHRKSILVAPLNWGLGHATRCIPIVKELKNQGFEPVIASDGAALELLRKEFPECRYYSLPSYNIKYSSHSYLLKIKMLLQVPHILKTVSAEKAVTEDLVNQLNISGIISDNRWGVRSKKVPSVFVTHQLNVLSGVTTGLSSKIHHNLIKKFDECWVPDNRGEPNLSGVMGHGPKLKQLKYIGLLSRFEKQACLKKYDLLVLLSGPEPQRQILENLLLRELRNLDQEILFVKGVVEKVQKYEHKNNFLIYNFLDSRQLQEAMNRSDLVLCRSGYTNLLDLAKLEKQAFLIPTPGQYEQEYLAGRLKNAGLLASCPQNKFRAGNLQEAKNYKSLKGFFLTNGFADAFDLFKGK